MTTTHRTSAANSSRTVHWTVAAAEPRFVAKASSEMRIGQDRALCVRE